MTRSLRPPPLLLLQLLFFLGLAALPNIIVNAEVTSFSVSRTLELTGGSPIMRGITLPWFNNTRIGSAVTLSVFLSDFVVNGTEDQVFQVDLDQQLLQKISNNSYTVLYSDGAAVINRVGSTDGYAIGHGVTVGPCFITLLQNPTQFLGVLADFKSNMTLSLNATVGYELFDNPLHSNQNLTIPNGRFDDFYTFMPSTSGSYDITMTLECLTPQVQLADRLSVMEIGCDNEIDFSTQQVSTWTQTFTGLSGPTYIELLAQPGSEDANDVRWTLVENMHSKKDSELKTWQIILIAVGGAVIVGVAALVLLAIAFVIYRKRSTGYHSLN